jgi:hypothetical protein
MKTLLFILASTLAFGQTALINGSSAKFRNVTGTAAPSSGTCDASSEVGSFYVRTGDQASVPTQVYVCKKTGASTYAWGPFFGYTQTAAPATCATGELWFDTDATAGSNLNLCTASNTWTAISGGGGSGTVNTGADGCLSYYAGAGTTLDDINSTTCRVKWNTTSHAVEYYDSSGTKTAELDTDTGQMTTYGTASETIFTDISTPSAPSTGQTAVYTKSGQLATRANGGSEVLYPQGNSSGEAIKGVAGAYDATSWNGSSETPTKDAVRDKIESLGGSAGAVVSKKCAAGSSLSGSAGPSTLGSYTFASGLAAGDMVRVTTFWTHSGGTTQTPRAQFNLGGTNVNVDAGSSTSWAATTDSTAAMDFVIQVVSTSSQRVQGGYYRFGGITAPYSNISATSLGVTTSGSTALDIVGSFASGTAETLSLDHYCIELVPAA